MGTARAIQRPAIAPAPGVAARGAHTPGRVRPATTVRLVLPASAASLEPARATVRRALRAGGWRPEAVEPVVLAVSEALGNAVQHGSEPGARIVLAMSVTGRRARVRVIDHGRSGALCPEVPPAPPAPSSEHGRGLIIMAAIARSVSVRRRVRGTEGRLAFTEDRLRAA